MTVEVNVKKASNEHPHTNSVADPGEGPGPCLFLDQTEAQTSSETQGQIVCARESLNGRKNMAQRRKVKNGE